MSLQLLSQQQSNQPFGFYPSLSDFQNYDYSPDVEFPNDIFNADNGEEKELKEYMSIDNIEPSIQAPSENTLSHSIVEELLKELNADSSPSPRTVESPLCWSFDFGDSPWTSINKCTSASDNSSWASGTSSCASGNSSCDSSGSPCEFTYSPDVSINTPSISDDEDAVNKNRKNDKKNKNNLASKKSREKKKTKDKKVKEILKILENKNVELKTRLDCIDKEFEMLTAALFFQYKEIHQKADNGDKEAKLWKEYYRGKAKTDEAFQIFNKRLSDIDIID